MGLDHKQHGQVVGSGWNAPGPGVGGCPVLKKAEHTGSLWPLRRWGRRSWARAGGPVYRTGHIFCNIYLRLDKVLVSSWAVWKRFVGYGMEHPSGSLCLKLTYLIQLWRDILSISFCECWNISECQTIRPHCCRLSRITGQGFSHQLVGLINKFIPLTLSISDQIASNHQLHNHASNKSKISKCARFAHPCIPADSPSPLQGSPGPDKAQSLRAPTVTLEALVHHDFLFIKPLHYPMHHPHHWTLCSGHTSPIASSTWRKLFWRRLPPSQVLPCPL